MAKGSRWDSEPGPPPEKTPGSESIAMPPKVGSHLGRLQLVDAVIQKNAVGHYYIVGYLPGGIRVAGWLHERPLPDPYPGPRGREKVHQRTMTPADVERWATGSA